MGGLCPSARAALRNCSSRMAGDGWRVVACGARPRVTGSAVAKHIWHNEQLSQCPLSMVGDAGAAGLSAAAMSSQWLGAPVTAAWAAAGNWLAMRVAITSLAQPRRGVRAMSRRRTTTRMAGMIRQAAKSSSRPHRGGLQWQGDVEMGTLADVAADLDLAAQCVFDQVVRDAQAQPRSSPAKAG